MGNHASLELCKELYELSGWWDDNLEKYDSHDGTIVRFGNIPAYSLGFLIRKLPAMIEDGGVEHWLTVEKHEQDDYMVAYSGHGSILIGSPHADTPEDALAKLAIELHKAGILGGDR